MAEIQTIRVYVLTDEDGTIKLEWFIEWKDKTGVLASARACSGPFLDPNFIKFGLFSVVVIGRCYSVLFK